MTEDIFGSAAQGEEKETAKDFFDQMTSVRDTSQLNAAIPKRLHKQLRIYSAVTDREIREIVVTSLVEYLAERDTAWSQMSDTEKG